MRKGFTVLVAAVLGALILTAFGAGPLDAAAEKVMVEKEKGEDKAFLGVFMSELTEKMMKKHGYRGEAGVLVSSVIDDSPADEAGIEEGDIIISIEGEEIEDAEHLADEVARRKPGDRVEIEVFRDGEKMELDVELGEKEEEIWVLDLDDEDINRFSWKMSRMGKQLGRSVGEIFHSYRWKLSGLEVTGIDSDMAGYFDVDPGEGVLVTGVREESMAAEIGIRSGDIIVRVDGEDISSVDELNEALEECEEEYELEVVRKGDRKKFEVEPGDYEEYHHPHTLGGDSKLRIKIPRRDIVDLETMKMTREFEKELEEELEELREKLKELKNRLEKIEKERD